MTRRIAVAAVAVMVLFLGACTQRRVVGSGVNESEERSVTDFTEVSLSGLGILTIELTDRQSLSIEAEDNILPWIETKLEGERLTIGFKEGADIFPTKVIRYNLTAVNLDAIDLSGAGSIEAKDVLVDHLEVSISGAGSLTVSGSVDHQDIMLSGLGSYRARDLASNTAEIIVSGAGNATIRVTGRLEATISGAGNVTYYGDPVIEADVTGLGRVKAAE
jgi:hypothetical protein